MSEILQFKRGSLASFNTLKQSNVFEKGTFYFVEDTNRLYLAKETDDLVDLNQYIHFATSSTLPATAQDGDFYYLTDSNIFAVYDSSASPHWIQVNPDTSLATSGDGSGATPSSFSVTGRANDTGVDLSQSIRDTSGKAFTSSMSLVAGQNISISTTGTTVTISARDQSTNTTYQLTVDSDNSGSQGILKLHGSDNTDNVVNFAAADDIEITSGDVSGTKTITIGGAHNVASMSQTFAANGAITTTLSDSNSSPLATASITPTLRYGQVPSDITFDANGIATLPVYSQTEIDTLLSNAMAQANALTYQGVINTSNYNTIMNSSSTAVQGRSTGNVGDTYLVSEAFNAGGVDYMVGDMAIAKGADGAVEWERVPSGDDQILTFNNSGTTNPAILVTDNITSNPVGGIVFTTDSRTATSKILYSGSTNASGQLAVEIRHGVAGAGTAVAASATAVQSYPTNATVSLPVVSAISVDEHGHVSSATVTNLSVTDTHATMDTINQSVAAIGNDSRRVKYAGTIGLDSGSSGSTLVELSLLSDNLTITPLSDTATQAINSVADSTKKVPTMKINMEWGTF